MIRKFMLTLMTASLLLSLTACGQSFASRELTPPDSTAQNVEEVETSTSVESIDANENAAKKADENTETAKETLTEASLGPVSFTPNANGYSMVYGSNLLHAYFKREDVKPGTGHFLLKKTSDDSVVEDINLQAKGKCTVGEKDTTFHLLDWNGGTHLIIHLKALPESGESYYVALEEGAFTSKDGKIRSKEVNSPTAWTINVAKFGIIPDKASGSKVMVGDRISASIYVKQPAVIAKIENFDENRVRFNEKEFEKDGKLEINIYQIGDDPFTVNFYDKGDDLLGSITLSYNAEMPPEPEKEAPKKSVTSL